MTKTKTAPTNAAPRKGTKAGQPAKAAPKAVTAPKATKVTKSDVIKSVTSIASGMDGLAADADGQKTIIIPKAKLNAVVLKLAVVGGSYAALAKAVAEASQAQLARGIKGREAPHSAKALADNAAALKATAPKADPKAEKPAKAAKARLEAKKEERKAERASWKQDRTYKVVAKLDDINMRPGTWTETMITVALAHTSTDKANAALAKHREFGDRKIDWKWLSDTRGYIKFA